MTEPDSRMEDLFEGVGVRPEPPGVARQQAYEATLAVLRREKVRRRRRTGVVMAFAASVVATLLVLLQPVRGPMSIEVRVADAGVLKLDGSRIQAGDQRLSLQNGANLVATHPARLVVGADTDLRLGEDTSIIWRGPVNFELDRGTVFVDTGDTEDVSIHTIQGTVKDIGTQFLVAVEGEAVIIAMREGKAIIENGRGSFSAVADGRSGEVLSVSEHEVNRRWEPISGPRWEWIHSVPRGYSATRIAVLLEQIALDQGLTLEYADSGTSAWVANQQLHGPNLERLTPQQAMEVLAATAELHISISTEGTLIVARR